MEEQEFISIIKDSDEYKNFNYKIEEFNDELNMLEEYINSADDSHFSKSLLEQLDLIKKDLEEEKNRFQSFLDEQLSIYLKSNSK